MLKVTVLGCGASSGVPLIGCKCPVCASDNPKNKRTRVSIVLRLGDAAVLIDTSPDLRAQCLREDIRRIDALVFTHAHADHLHGVDDMRSFNYLRNSPIDTFADAETLRQITERFGYVFLPPKPTITQGDLIWLRPCLTPITIKPFEPFKAAGIELLPFTQKHGGSTTLGLRCGGFAYSTDVNGMPEESLVALRGIDTWIVDCLRYEPSPTHADLKMALDWIAQVRPKRAYLTHLNHGFDYDKLAAELPSGVFPAYDGLELQI